MLTVRIGTRNGRARHKWSGWVSMVSVASALVISGSAQARIERKPAAPSVQEVNIQIGLFSEEETLVGGGNEVEIGLFAEPVITVAQSDLTALSRGSCGNRSECWYAFDQGEALNFSGARDLKWTGAGTVGAADIWMAVDRQYTLSIYDTAASDATPLWQHVSEKFVSTIQMPEDMAPGEYWVSLSAELLAPDGYGFAYAQTDWERTCEAPGTGSGPSIAADPQEDVVVPEEEPEEAPALDEVCGILLQGLVPSISVESDERTRVLVSSAASGWRARWDALDADQQRYALYGALAALLLLLFAIFRRRSQRY